MPNGIPAYSQNTFPNEKYPTMFSPASPKTKPAKESTKDSDAASVASFSSTVGLLKNKLHRSSEKKEPKPRAQKQPDQWNARARTAEAYMFIAMSK